jgi:hypothetical protein
LFLENKEKESIMSKKEKQSINVDEAVSNLLDQANKDEGFKTLLTGLLSQTALRQQVMTKALIAEWQKNGKYPELLPALNTLMNMDVARKVRQALLAHGK